MPPALLNTIGLICPSLVPSLQQPISTESHTSSSSFISCRLINVVLLGKGVVNYSTNQETFRISSLWTNLARLVVRLRPFQLHLLVFSIFFLFDLMYSKIFLSGKQNKCQHWNVILTDGLLSEKKPTKRVFRSRKIGENEADKKISDSWSDSIFDETVAEIEEKKPELMRY